MSTDWRELINGIVEERTSAASDYPNLIDDLVEAVAVVQAEERERCAKAIEAEVDKAAGTIGELMVYAVCAETVRQLGGGPCEN